MEFIIIVIISIILLFVLKYIFDYSIKEIKKIAEDKELDEIANKYPENIELCKKYLKILDNENVQIEENEDSEASLYIAITNKIVIANVRSSYSRIQTIAHECLHSIQNRKMLMFNFIFSNIYLLYFLIISILSIFNILPFQMMFLSILLIFSGIYCLIRNYLENDAMIKAKFLAKEYMEKEKISSKEEIQKMVNKFDMINNIGIKCTNYNLFLNSIIKVIIFATICSI